MFITYEKIDMESNTIFSMLVVVIMALVGNTGLVWWRLGRLEGKVELLLQKNANCEET